MYISTFFLGEGSPALGLSPIILIRKASDGSLVVSGTMTEAGDGLYVYDFTAQQLSETYGFLFDSVTLSGTKRYTYGYSGEYGPVLTDIESSVGNVDIKTELLRKIQTNRLDLLDGDFNNWILYDDDDVTPLLTFDVTDKDNTLILQQPHVPSKRSKAVGTISGTFPPTYLMLKSVYDPDDDGIVNAAETVSDGTYISVASGVKYAVDNTHSPYRLGTKYINEFGMSDERYVKYNAETDSLEFGIPGVSGIDVGINKSGRVPIVSGINNTSIVFGGPFPDNSYSLILGLENSIDSPASEYAYTVVSKTVSGFTVKYSGDIDSSNYYLNWYATTSGINTGNYLSDVVNDVSPQLGGDLDLNHHGINFVTSLSGNLGYSGNILTGTISYSIYGDNNDFAAPMYVRSDGTWRPCTAASGTIKMPCNSMAIDIGTGSNKKLLQSGTLRKDSWSWTPGNTIYVSTVEGALTNVKPSSSGSWKQEVAVALASNIILVSIKEGSINS